MTWLNGLHAAVVVVVLVSAVSQDDDDDDYKQQQNQGSQSANDNTNVLVIQAFMCFGSVEQWSCGCVVASMETTITCTNRKRMDLSWQLLHRNTARSTEREYCINRKEVKKQTWLPAPRT